MHIPAGLLRILFVVVLVVIRAVAVRARRRRSKPVAPASGAPDSVASPGSTMASEDLTSGKPLTPK
jgi:hypothetical protein